MSSMKLATLVLLGALLAACQPSSSGAEQELAKVRQELQKKTERIYWIHLRLDTAATEISNAEIAARDGNTSAAEFHAAEAYRSIEQADQALLELGTQIQEIAGLDRNQD